jgi:hypothetical protein
MSSSSARRRANRRNSKKSTGPSTPEGKASVSQNARQHGLVGGFCVLAHENRQEFEELLHDYRTEFKPISTDETFLIEQMAQARWTLARARRIEAHLLNRHAGASLPDDDPDARIAIHLDDKSDTALNTIHRYVTTAERSYFRCRRELQQGRSRELRNKANDAKNWLKEQVRGAKPPREMPPPDPSIWSPDDPQPYVPAFQDPDV